MKQFRAALREADVLIIVPPFAVLHYPSLAAHLLQACGREAGFQVQVLYANILLASVIGEEGYSGICSAPMRAFAGERFFARCAFGLPPLGHNVETMFDPVWRSGSDKAIDLRLDISSEQGKLINLSELNFLEAQATDWVDQVAIAVSERTYKVVGCTTMFEQTSASIALLNRIKQRCEDTVTILGGANCEGEMAQGIASLDASIDYIFSGESEATFPKFIRDVLAGSRPKGRLIYGEPCKRMDTLPTPMFSDFYEQREQFLPNSKTTTEETLILYETSRGCWWGQKQHCTFCGLNGEGMAFRQKSPDRVLVELRTLLAAHPSRHIQMTDNIMPHGYFKTLLPRLGSEFPELTVVFYEQKANLSLSNVLSLKKAGITAIQPGIEALSSRLLRQMKKGIRARQNLMLLRNARAAGLQLYWNLLWGFPNDERKAYEETLAIIPLIYHLPPPTGFTHLSIDRFSPYFFQPEKFGVSNIRPQTAYHDFLPRLADVQQIAYHFLGDYRCGAHDHIDVIHKLFLEVRRWQLAWQHENGKLPELRICFYRGGYVLVDTRRLPDTERAHILDRSEAALLLNARPYTGSEQEIWALEKKLAVIADSWFVPLVVADPEILLEFEAEQERRMAPKNPQNEAPTSLDG